MILQVFHELRPLLRHPRIDLSRVAVLSAIGGVFEATVLVLVVNAAVAIADGTTGTAIELPIVGVDMSLGAVLWWAGGLAVAVALVNAVVAWWSARLGTEVLVAARHRAIAAFLAASWEKQSTEREGALQETVTTLASQASLLTMALSNGIAGGLGLAALLLTALFIDAVVALVVLVFGVGLFVLLRPLGELTRRRSAAYVAANRRYSEHIARTAAMSMELRVFGTDAPVLGELDRSNATVGEELRRTRFSAAIGTNLYRNTAVLFLVAAVAALNLAGGERLVEVSAVALLIVRSLGYATSVQGAVQQVGVNLPGLEALNERSDDLAAHRERSGSTELSSFERIELRGVGYSYDERTQALRDVDLTIRAGDVLGVVGPSGSGKSTLLQVLLRLRLPVTGSVRVDGLDYADIDRASWSRLVAVVPQEPRLMEASVADNIAFMRPGLTRADVEQAADDAHVGDEIRDLPNGFDTVLGPHGSGLSGGQKQRVAFARALVGRPRLLILDEPTSALDGESERRIQETIIELKDRVTLVIVAHRLSTLDVCDRAISMKAGRVEIAELPTL